MKEFLEILVDFLAVIFGDTPQRPRAPRPMPPALPSPPPVVPRADPNEPQDAQEINQNDYVVISHEGEPPREGGSGQEFDSNPLPAPDDDLTTTEPPLTKPSTPVPPAPEYRARYMWCIDNGHGALTKGKRSPVLPDGRQLLEYEFNRAVTRLIFQELDRLGVPYYNVVPEVQVGNFLNQRVERVNNLSSALPKLFVSIHGNAGPAPSVNEFTSDDSQGIETWYYNGSIKGRKMAAVFQKHIIRETGLQNRHLRSRVTGQFYVLRATRMPAILTENGFFNNRFDLPVMLTDAYRQKVADAHVSAILEIDRKGL